MHTQIYNRTHPVTTPERLDALRSQVITGFTQAAGQPHSGDQLSNTLTHRRFFP